MAQLNHVEETIIDTLGNAVVTGTVTIRRQGAHVNEAQSGTSPFTVNVNDPGAIVDGDTVAIDAGATTYTATTVTATTIILTGFAGTLVLSNKQRITPTLVPPSLFLDPNGEDASPTGAVLTTDSNGYVSAWATVSRYDALVEKAGLATRLYVDRIAQGAERITSNMFNSASAVAVIQDTARSITTAGAKLHSWRNLGVEKAYIDKDGDGSFSDVLAGGTLAVTGTSTMTGAVTMGSTLTMTSATSQIIPGATSFAIRNNANNADNLLITDAGAATIRNGLTVTAGGATITAGGLTITAGDLAATASLANFKRMGATGGASLVIGDFSFTGGWGTTAAITAVGGNDTRGDLRIQSNGTGQSANPSITMTFKDGTYTTSAFCIACNGPNFTVLDTNDRWYVSGPTPTSVSFIYGGTPVATRLYELRWFVLK